MSNSTPPVPARWTAPLAAGLLAAVTVIGVLRFPATPDPMPTHWNALMEPDAWGERSLGGFLAPVLIGFIPVVLLWVMPLLARLQNAPLPEPAAGEEERVLLSLRESPDAVAAAEVARFCHGLALAIATLISLIALLSWFGVTGLAAAVPVWAGVALLFATIGVGTLRLRRSR